MERRKTEKKQAGKTTPRRAALYRGKLWLTTALCAALLLSGMTLAGCNSSAGDNKKPDGNVEEYSAKLWFVNQEYLDSGDESLPRYIVEDRSVDVNLDESQYKSVLTALAEAPSQEDGAATMLKDESEIKAAELDEDGKTVIVDFDSEKLSGGGSEEELCLIEQIVWTLTESFDEVEQVRFTVDGAEKETLMGHMDISVPYGITSVDNGEGEGTDTVMPLYE